MGPGSLPSWPIGHHFLDWQGASMAGILANGVPGRQMVLALAAPEQVVSLLLDGAAEGRAGLCPLLLPRRRLTDVDDDDVATEVHHLTVGDEGGVVVSGHLT